MEINTQTKKLGLIGNPLGHSLSPLMHNMAMTRMGYNGIYLPIEVAAHRLGEAVRGLRALDFTGVNVTIPYKQAVITYLDELSPEAQACQAVNLIQNLEGRLIGHNTDGSGFMASLEEAGVTRLTRVLIIGAGGAARSVVYQLAQAGAAWIDILDLVPERAASLARFVEQIGPVRAAGHFSNPTVWGKLAPDADLVINCSPVGMYPEVEKAPVDSLELLKPAAVVYDLIYNPPATKFLGMAAARHLLTVNGISMLVHQGALTLEILTGAEPPLAYMKEVIVRAIAEK